MEGSELERRVRLITTTYVVGSVLNLNVDGRPLLYPFFALALVPHLRTLGTARQGTAAPLRVRGLLTAIAVVVTACLATWLPVGASAVSALLVIGIVAVIVGLRLWARSMARWCDDLEWSPAADFRRAIRPFEAAIVALSATAATVVVFGPRIDDAETVPPNEVLFGHSTRTWAALVPALLFLAAMIVGHLRLRRAQRALRAGLVARTEAPDRTRAP